MIIIFNNKLHGKDDKLGLRINKDFFVHIFDNKNKMSNNLVSEISDS